MARSFDGTDDYLEYGGAVVTGVPMTLAAWVNINTGGGGIVIGLSNSGTDQDRQYVRCAIGSVTMMTERGGVSGTATASAGPTANVWGHVCGVSSAVDSRAAYFNGANKGTNATSATPNLNITDIGVWRRLAGLTFPYTGIIAEVAIWSAALTDDEVASLGKGFAPPLIRPQSLVSYWPLFGLLSPEPDRWKSGFNMTVNSAPAKADHKPMRYPMGAL